MMARQLNVEAMTAHIKDDFTRELMRIMLEFENKIQRI